MFPPKPCSRPRCPGAFTLVELLVSMTVLVLIVVMVSQLVNSATKVTTGNNKHLDADGQSRQVFERMALDLAKMVRRVDADNIFAKLPLQGAGGSGRDDKMFFYSEVPAVFDGDASLIPSRSSVALVGYRINAGFQLERLGKLLTWDGTFVPGGAPGGVMFLSSPNAAKNPDPLSTLAGNWPQTIGTTSDPTPYSNATDDADYNVLAEQVFRMEVCYLIRPVAHTDPASSGYVNIAKYSSLPIAAPEGVGMTNNLTATAPPTASDDIGKGYVAGSRWYDNANSRAYMCTSNKTGAAVWSIIGMQDVMGIVVAVAILDGTTSKALPTLSVKLNSKQAQNSRVPDLTSLNNVFSDLASDLGSKDTTLPDLSITPPRLMAEAWRNTMLKPNFAQAAGVPPAVAAQVRIYQRYFPLNTPP